MKQREWFTKWRGSKYQASRCSLKSGGQCMNKSRVSTKTENTIINKDHRAECHKMNWKIKWKSLTGDQINWKNWSINSKTGQWNASRETKKRKSKIDLRTYQTLSRGHTTLYRGPRGKEKEKGEENLFEEIISENIPNLVILQIQEVQWVPNKLS